MSDAAYPKLSPMRTGVACRCPRCGEGRLFAGFLKLSSKCEVCGLDLTFADPADGPAFFVMSIVSFLSVGFAALFQLTFWPPLWMLLLATSVVVLGPSLALLRPVKGWLVNSQYFYNAEEARLAEPRQPG